MKQISINDLEQISGGNDALIIRTAFALSGWATGLALGIRSYVDHLSENNGRFYGCDRLVSNTILPIAFVATTAAFGYAAGLGFDNAVKAIDTYF